jgi:hypothetical protein
MEVCRLVEVEDKELGRGLAIAFEDCFQGLAGRQLPTDEKDVVLAAQFVGGSRDNRPGNEDLCFCWIDDHGRSLCRKRVGASGPIGKSDFEANLLQ